MVMRSLSRSFQGRGLVCSSLTLQKDLKAGKQVQAFKRQAVCVQASPRAVDGPRLPTNYAASCALVIEARSRKEEQLRPPALQEAEQLVLPQAVELAVRAVDPSRSKQ